MSRDEFVDRNIVLLLYLHADEDYAPFTSHSVHCPGCGTKVGRVEPSEVVGLGSLCRECDATIWAGNTVAVADQFSEWTTDDEPLEVGKRRYESLGPEDFKPVVMADWERDLDRNGWEPQVVSRIEHYAEQFGWEWTPGDNR